MLFRGDDEFQRMLLYSGLAKHLGAFQASECCVATCKIIVIKQIVWCRYDLRFPREIWSWNIPLCELQSSPRCRVATVCGKLLTPNFDMKFYPSGFWIIFRFNMASVFSVLCSVLWDMGSCGFLILRTNFLPFRLLSHFSFYHGFCLYLTHLREASSTSSSSFVAISARSISNTMSSSSDEWEDPFLGEEDLPGSLCI